MCFDLPPLYHNDYDEMVLAVCESTEEQFGSSFWPKLLHWNVDWPWCRSSSWWAMMMILLSFSLWCWCFLAALAALGLPWILTVLSYWLLWIQSLPDQTETMQNWWRWWENMNWPTKRQRQRQIQRQRLCQCQWHTHLENTSKERSLRLLTF